MSDKLLPNGVPATVENVPDGFRDVISDLTATRLIEMVLGIGEVAEMVDKLKTMPDHELGGLLIDHVWAYLPSGTPQSKLLDEVIDRLSRGGEWEDCDACRGAGCLACNGYGSIWVASEPAAAQPRDGADGEGVSRGK